VRRNAQAINVLISSRKPSEYPEMMIQLRQVARKLKAQSKRKNVKTSTINGYTCLEIGAREGRLLQCWPEDTPLPTEYVALERNPKYNPLLRASMREKHVTGSIIHSRRQPNEIESLQRRKNKFDLIIFSHSLYWMSNNAAEIVHETVQTLLHENGICLIFHHAFGFYSLWHLMERQFFRDKPVQVQPHSSGSSAVQLVSALQQIQQRQGKQERNKAFPYTAVVAAMDPCPLYLNAMQPHQWDETLSFIFQIEASELPPNIREETIQLVLGSATQTSEETDETPLGTSLHSSTPRYHQHSTRSRSISSASSSGGSTMLTSSSHHSTIDGSEHTTQQTIHDKNHNYWLHHPHVTIKITRDLLEEDGG
jgi:Methyltransferase domain